MPSYAYKYSNSQTSIGMYSELLQDLTLHQRIFKAEYITVEYLTVMIRVVLCLMYLLNNQLSTGTLSAESVPFFIGEVMKKERKNRHCNHVSYDEYPFEDTRHYGLWVSGRREILQVKIDPKRFQKANGVEFTSEQLSVINKRKSQYFHPAKRSRSEYCCHAFVDELSTIKSDWENNFKKHIEITKKSIQKPRKLYAGDYFNLQAGISGVNSASRWAEIQNYHNEFEYQSKIYELVHGIYSQFIQQMASRIEAVTVRVLTDKGMIEDRFDRNILYGGINNDTPVRQLPHFSSHDKLYCIWNFVKHNSISTYKTLKERFSDVVIDQEFKQGDNALYYVNFSEELIVDLISGLTEFFKEYCQLMFGENYEQAQWNYNDYFLDIVRDNIELITNPLGLQWWDELD